MFVFNRRSEKAPTIVGKAVRTISAISPKKPSGLLASGLAAIILAVNSPHSAGDNSTPSFLSASSVALRIADRTRFCTPLSLSLVIALSRLVGIVLLPQNARPQRYDRTSSSSRSALARRQNDGACRVPGYRGERARARITPSRQTRALSAATAAGGLGHVDPDRLRHDRGIVRHMIFVP